MVSKLEKVMGFKVKRQRYQDEQHDAKVHTLFVPLLVVFVVSSAAMYIFYQANKITWGTNLISKKCADGIIYNKLDLVQLSKLCKSEPKCLSH